MKSIEDQKAEIQERLARLNPIPPIEPESMVSYGLRFHSFAPERLEEIDLMSIFEHSILALKRVGPTHRQPEKLERSLVAMLCWMFSDPQNKDRLSRRVNDYRKSIVTAIISAYHSTDMQKKMNAAIGYMPHTGMVSIEVSPDIIWINTSIQTGNSDNGSDPQAVFFKKTGFDDEDVSSFISSRISHYSRVERIEKQQGHKFDAVTFAKYVRINRSSIAMLDFLTMAIMPMSIMFSFRPPWLKQIITPNNEPNGATDDSAEANNEKSP